MEIDLNYLNRFGKIEVNQEVFLKKELYENSEVKSIEKLYVKGNIYIDYNDEIIVDFIMSGIMILPCAISLDDVSYSFETNINENLGKFDEIAQKNKNSLEISNILWENIVLEIPLRVVKEGAKPTNTSGDGWKLISK